MLTTGDSNRRGIASSLHGRFEIATKSQQKSPLKSQVHTYDASVGISASRTISTTKSTCEPGRRKHKRKKNLFCGKTFLFLMLALVFASSRFTRTFSCACVVREPACCLRVDFINAVYFRGLTCTLGLSNDFIDGGQPRAKNGF